MEAVEANSKLYEKLSFELDPMYDEWSAGVETVREFIIDNKLIVYGGTAIDYALRLHGDCIYPDGSVAIPDLDAYSPLSVPHAYQLADTLYRAGNKEARAIVASYIGTMKVDIGVKHWVADLSYVSPTIFAKLPYITYAGVRVIHPDFQRIDTHLALAFPFDDPPKEVIFNRVKKDIIRFGKLNAKYPVSSSGGPVETVTVRGDVHGHVFHGFAAYALWCHVLGDRLPKDAPRLGFRVTPSGYEFDSPVVTGASLDLINFDIHAAADELYGARRCGRPVYRAGVMNALPKTAIVVCDTLHITFFSTGNRLLSVGSAKIGDIRVRFAGIQYLAAYMMAMSYFGDVLRGESHESKTDRVTEGGGKRSVDNKPDAGDKQGAEPNADVVNNKTSPVAETYRAFYKALIAMTNIAGEPIPEVTCPGIHVYGNVNRNERENYTRDMALRTIGEEVSVPDIPRNYYPNKGGSTPAFDYDASAFFYKDGRVID